MSFSKFMVTAGEASGDVLAAELVTALKQQAPPDAMLEFFGAGGPHMAAAGVWQAFDLTAHSVVGLWEVIRKYFEFRRLYQQLLTLAEERRPEVFIGVDFSAFNRRLGQGMKMRAKALGGTWNPRLVQYVSPQVWASRPGRAQQMARDYELVLSIFPFEKAWYAEHAPGLRVEFVGHPIFNRHPANPQRWEPRLVKSAPGRAGNNTPLAGGVVTLLPGSRVIELKRHLPVLLGAWQIIHERLPGTMARMVLPNELLANLAQSFQPPESVQIQVGGLAPVLEESVLALACTGTVTVECAFFGVPAVTLYKTSWPTYLVAKNIVHVKYLSMPNLLTNNLLYPEFIQDKATAQAIGQAAVDLLLDPPRYEKVRSELARVVALLGEAGASQRAARHIWQMAEGVPAAAPLCR